MISAERIPNNVGLSSNKRLQRALEHWQPQYIQWWKDMGPQGFQDYHQVYVRTAVSVDPAGWAHFEYVKLPEYRWGIFLADPVHDRRIGFGQFFAHFDEENDGTIAVAETVIPGLDDHIVLPHSHVGMLFAHDVADQVAHFLRERRFYKDAPSERARPAAP